MMDIKEITDFTPEFSQNHIKKACKAAKGIFSWLVAL
jgi:hypothetical protein